MPPEAVSTAEFRGQRLHTANLQKSSDKRSPAQRDRDRLLYSSAFRRLAEVTQVVAASSGYVFHNRLTHSLQVSQVGRRLAEKLTREIPPDANSLSFEGLDPDVVEAAALAHDLGHPPFGHVVEEELNELAEDFGGYEGNAQSFRILCKLAFHSPRYAGLNLSRATLCAVLKYPWFRGENANKPKKWGAYNSEREEFEFARRLFPHTFEQSTEAFLMDWADDITYSVHDLEDFYRAGRIPLQLLAALDFTREREFLRERVISRHSGPEGNKDILKRIDPLLEKLRDLLLSTFAITDVYRGTSRQRSGLRSFVGSLIDRYINATKWRSEAGRLQAHVDPEFKDEVLMLKELTWVYVIQAPSLATQQVGQRHMVRTLFNVYDAASKLPSKWGVFPAFYQERLEAAGDDDDERRRTCIDLLAGMTESQVQRVFARVTGSSTEGSLSDPLN